MWWRVDLVIIVDNEDSIGEFEEFILFWFGGIEDLELFM